MFLKDTCDVPHCHLLLPVPARMQRRQGQRERRREGKKNARFVIARIDVHVPEFDIDDPGTVPGACACS